MSENFYTKLQKEMKNLSTEELRKKINEMVENNYPFYAVERVHQYYCKVKAREERESLQNGETI